ncbi:MAG: aminoacyl-tRNA hydrolase [Clostridium sp.]|nr:aminoacyl-tRNA hydrolase [Clostridium sp.]MCM1443785.1 aminoacyl-tRNA hydrolase [Candidatus Amulumruptor caecigallinarius]
MKLIVGLGNPGKEYENTRHNIGFMVLDKYAKFHEFSFNKKKFDGLYSKVFIEDKEVIFLKPQSYMNLSGTVIRKFVDYYKIDIDDILIINDDLDLNCGFYKLKYKGSSGGHNGLKNIELNLNTQFYKRLKIGISNDKTQETKNYVLGTFSKNDLNVLNKIIDISINIIDDYLMYDFDKLMNKYNSK